MMGAMAVHFLDAQLGIPQRPIYGAEFTVPRHDLAMLAICINGQPWGVLCIEPGSLLLRDGGKEVGVHVYFFHHG
jgi:hypothetical protein